MKIKTIPLILGSLLVSFLAVSAQAKDEVKEVVKITPELASVPVVHRGQRMVIKRNSDPKHVIPKLYTKTSRACPPFCIQPASLHPKVETIAELEMLDYLKKASTDASISVIDTRTPEWMNRGTIPGSINIPWTMLSVKGASAWEDAATAEEVMVNRFGVKVVNGKPDFGQAKTLILFCNGAWCPQSTENIRLLLKKGYPAEKLKWYRGGLQAWVSFGLSTTYFKK
ncbi:MAG: rhodanese-like domain-containing protein [Cocleimonas sp.]|nr:rhodanese-like domain-containing protein [Cocleimonas sp.]